MAGIKIDVHYKQPPHVVWRALTDPDLLARWLMPNNFRPEPGCEFEFRAKPVGGWDGIARCKVLEIDPPNKLAYSWKSNKIETVVTFTLRPEDGGTWLRFSHAGFAGAGGFVAKLFMGSGWRKKLHKSIPEIVAGV
jgi:uncharacterized protein YndB with AHSA1/START domain